MKINKIVINNFRSIKAAEFSPTNICALVGGNNAGKTNVLAALNFLLGEVWPSKRGLEQHDYYNQDTSQPIHIELEFASNPRNIRKVWCTVPWDEQVETKVEYTGGGRVYPLNTGVREQCALVSGRKPEP